ncbi:MAG: YybH family protein [Candidatus Rokuibacteriota bacterium]
MKVLITVLLVLILAAPAVAADGSEEDKQALRAIARLFEQAVGERDLGKFQAVLAPEFVGTLVTDEVVNRESIARFWDWVWGLIGRDGRWEVKIDPDDTLFFGDIAVARGVANDHIVTASGRDYRFTWHWTLVLQKRDGHWKAMAGHGSMDPLGNPFIRVERTWTRILFGGGGLLVGLLAGAGGTLLLRRRR